MRIIAGELGGRRIAAPPGKGTRPMLDRVREALFSSLGARVEGAAVLDLFAGSGSLGLEALSRGAASVRLVESDRRAVALLRQTLEALAVAERVELVPGDALAPASWGERPWDLVFFDPPYRMIEDGRSRAELQGSLARLFAERIAPGGLAVLHAPRGRLLAGDFQGLAVRARPYGTNDLWYLERRSS
jgi:16S rRNA (guanine(966)-N(2))-methyltransferase RsmD